MGLISRVSSRTYRFWIVSKFYSDHYKTKTTMSLPDPSPQVKDFSALVLGLASFYFLTQPDYYIFDALTRVMLAIFGGCCCLYFMLNKINDTFGIEGFENPNKDYTVYKYCETKRKAACDEVLRPEKGNK